MRKIYQYIMVAVAAMTMVSCNTDELDIEQQGVLTINEYKTANDHEVEQFISAIYAEVYGDSYQSVLVGQVASYRSFVYELNRMGAETANYYAYNESADAGTYSKIWSYFYRTIYWCNMIIENLPANEVATPSVKNQVLAEARTIRAISMMYLVQLYGNPPLADHIMNGSEGNTPAADSWAFIESELTAAAEALPTKSGLGGQSVIGGRLTREAAYAYLGKAQLWQKKYSEAASTLYNKVIATGKYALYDNFEDYNSSKSDFSDENIWEFEFNEDSNSAQSQEGCFDIACFSPVPSVWFDGVHCSPLMSWGMGANASADFAKFLEMHDGKEKVRYTSSLMDVCTASTKAMVTPPIAECDGYFKMKDFTYASDLVGQFPYYYSLRNTAYMRYSEVLLNYAEAVAQGGTEEALSGLEALNMVRRRAGLEDAPALDMNNETYGVKAERRAELYAEGHRFIDLVRWGDAPTALADCGKKAYTCSDLGASYDTGQGFSMYFGPVTVTSSETGGQGFKAGKNELFPIPTTEVKGTLKQNPNW